MLIWPLILVLTAGALTTWALVVLLMARARLYPPRLTPLRALFLLGRANPKDLGFEFEPMEFTSQAYGGHLKLRASLVRHAEADGVLVILLHGYADSSAGAMAWLAMLHRQRVNVLLLDLPGHGDSDEAPCTAGWKERECVWEVIDQLRAGNPADAQLLVLYGLSMGAAVALAATHLRPGIAAVIADSPYSDFRKASVRHSRLFGLPGAIFQRPATWLIARRWGIRYEELAPLHLLGQVRCPVLLIQAGQDLLISPADRDAMDAIIRQRPECTSLMITEAYHLLPLSAAPGEYERAVSHFLSSLRANVCDC